MPRGTLLLGAALLAATAATLAGRAARADPPACAVRPTPALSAEMPADVCIPEGFTGIAVDYFDDYSWRAFVALVWPAAAAERGVPAAASSLREKGPRVFETYKPLWEIFHADGSDPVAFSRYDAAAQNPCGATPRYGDVTIGSPSGIDDIGQAGIGVLDAPVVAQNGRYVRTLTLFNRTAYDHIVTHGYFRRANLPRVPSPRPERPVIDFPIGSIAVKSAWIDMTGLSPSLLHRFYTRQALVKRATGRGCVETTIGLIGLHVAQKTPTRPQWIWSSFEQKEAIPPKWADWPGAFALHDGSSVPMPATNPLSLVPLAPEPVHPFNVTRDAGAPILTDTELTSHAWQRALEGTPWQFYRLVVTQWPRLEGNQADAIPARIDGSIANTFPGEGAFSAFANVTMETFNQKGVQLGCMSCHNRARMTADFMWSVTDHAYPPRFGPAPTR